MKWARAITIFLVILVLTVGFHEANAADDTDLLDALDQEIATETDAGASDLDLLDEVEATVPTEQHNGTFKYVSMIGTNLEGSLRLRGHAFFQDPTDREGVDDKNPVGEALLRFNTWTGNDSLKLDFSGWVEAGTQEDTYDGISRWPQDKERRRHYLELNELYMTLFQNSYDVTLGKKIFTNGISTLYSPADRYRIQDMNDPLDPKDLGMWQIRGDYYLDQHTFTAAVFPVFNTSKYPSGRSRWSDTTGDYNIYEEDTENKEIEEDYPALSINSMGYFARAKTTLRGWDLFTSFYQGLNPYYVLREETRGGTDVLIKENVKVGNYAAGFSTTFGKWEFHGEVLYNHSYDGKDDNYLNSVGGVTYTIDEWARKLFLEKIDITIEYGGEIITKKQYAETYTESSRKSRLGRKDLFTRINFKYNEDLSFQYISDFEFAETGRFNCFKSEYRIMQGLVWTAALEFFDGEDSSYYGRWSRNDRFIMDLEYSF